MNYHKAVNTFKETLNSCFKAVKRQPDSEYNFLFFKTLKDNRYYLKNTVAYKFDSQRLGIEISSSLMPSTGFKTTDERGYYQISVHTIYLNKPWSEIKSDNDVLAFAEKVKEEYKEHAYSITNEELEL